MKRNRQFRNNFSFKHSIVGVLIRQNAEAEEDKFGSNLCLLHGLKPVIFLGRCFGAISRADIFENGQGQAKRKVNPAFIMSLMITLFLLFNSVLLIYHNWEKFQRDKTVLVKLEGFNHAGYAVSMFFIYLYQLFSSIRIRNIVKSFLILNRASQLPSFTERKGISKFPKFSWIILIICLMLGIFENIVFDWQSLQRGVGKNKCVSILMLYYTQNFKHWHIILTEYNPPLTLLLASLTKLATWGWVYMDVICALLCRAVWEKLWIIGERLYWSPFDEVTKDQQKSENSALGNPRNKILQNDMGIYKDEYVMVTDLVEQVSNYISPLIVVCYVGNMYILIVMLFNWIGPFSTEEVSREKTIHVCFAFLQFFFRVAIITYFAGEVHQMCLVIRRRIQMCPNSMYIRSLERLERILIANPAGICLFGSFVITRKFFVSIVSFIFTTEIVLLQSYSGYYAVNNNAKTTPAI